MARGAGSMMLLDALQRAPRFPVPRDDAEPQASIYATKAADEGALDAWRANVGMHDRAAMRDLQDQMQQRELAGAMNVAQTRAGTDAQSSLMRYMAAMAKVRGDQDSADADRKSREKIAEDDRNVKKAIADQNNKRLSNPRVGTQKAPKDEGDKVFEDALNNITRELSSVQGNVPMTSENSEAVYANRASAEKSLHDRQNAILALRAEYHLALRNGDKPGADRALSALVGMTRPTPQKPDVKTDAPLPFDQMPGVSGISDRLRSIIVEEAKRQLAEEDASNSR